MNKNKFMLESKTKQPEYQRLDIEPLVGGKSLLHEGGMPKVVIPKRNNIPLLKEISGDPVLIKAYEQNSDDDKFIPPKSNFVSVGHVDHSWYSDKVTGIQDNNEYVDIENLQGINPLAHITPAISNIAKKLDHAKTLIIAELSQVNSTIELKNLKENIFGKNGIFTKIVLQSDSSDNSIGELLSHVYDEINLDIQGKEYELSKTKEEDEEDLGCEKWPEDMAAIPYEQVQEKDEMYPDGIPKRFPTFPAIPEGNYGIIIDELLVGEAETLDEAHEAITDLLLTKNIDLNRVQLVKRIKIGFGVILGE